MTVAWEQMSLGEVMRLEYGKPLDEAHRNPLGRFPIYGANGEKGRTDKCYHDKPSIIVGRKGSAGEINLSEGAFWPLDVTYFVKYDEVKYDLRFLYYLLATLELTKLAKGVKPGINREEVYSKIVSVPKLSEQHRIVAILEEVFAGTAAAKANAEKNIKNADAIFVNHLQALFARYADGWMRLTLRQIATDFGRGKSKHRPRNDPKLYGGLYPFIQTGDVRGSDHLITEYSQTYSAAGLAQSKLWPKGTLCITIAANIAETGVLDFDACFPDSVIGVVVNPELASTKFLEYLLQSFKSVLQAKGKGSAQDNINLATFENQRFPFPTIQEQKSIVAKLDSLREEIRRLESIYRRKLGALDQLKQSLLHQAFSGKL